MAYDINKVITIAEKEVGYLEKDNKNDLNSKTGNAGDGNYTKYWAELKPSLQGNPWCNCFTTWCFKQAYGEAAAKQLLCTPAEWNFYTPSTAGYFKAKNQWHTAKPQRGDLIYFQNSTRICHIGLVYKVAGNKVYTIEGNTSSTSGVVANGGGVFKKEYSLDNNRIAGYGRPSYGAQSTVSTSSAANNKNLPDVITPNRVAICNTVNADALNIREKPSVTSKAVGMYNKGEKLIIDSVSGEWFHTDKGWVKGAYIKSATRISTGTLNIRKGPDTSYTAIEILPRNTEVMVLAEKNDWYLTHLGWCSGKYLSK